MFCGVLKGDQTDLTSWWILVTVHLIQCGSKGQERKNDILKREKRKEKRGKGGGEKEVKIIQGKSEIPQN